MKTLLISSSLAKNSKSLILVQNVAKKLEKLGSTVELVDAKNLNLTPTHVENSNEMDDFIQKVATFDNIVIGMGVHCYSMSDSLKIILDTCLKGAENKFFGIVCAAGGERSYLSTQHVTQVCMNEYRMIQLPRILYVTGKDFSGGVISSEDILERLDQFAQEFYTIGNKLL